MIEFSNQQPHRSIGSGQQYYPGSSQAPHSLRYGFRLEGVWFNVSFSDYPKYNAKSCQLQSVPRGRCSSRATIAEGTTSITSGEEGRDGPAICKMAGEKGRRRLHHALANTVSSGWKARREQESCKCKLRGDGRGSRARAAAVRGSVFPKSVYDFIVVAGLYIRGVLGT